MKLFIIFMVFFASQLTHAKNKKIYKLVIDEKLVNFSGASREAMAINGSVPGPTLKFVEGDIAEIHVTNKMDIQTSVHWHGLILPNFQDGVPYLTTPPIRPGKTFVYKFPIKHSGTYWYHSHTGLQEQRGIYGSIIIEPKKKNVQYDRDLVLVLSDWTDENPNEVLRTLKRGSEWYSIKKKTAVSLLEAVSYGATKGLLSLWAMRMPGIDISDVYYNAFLTNGQKNADYPEFKPGERVRVRMINAAASTYFWVTFGGNKTLLVSSDGIDVEPTKTSKVLHAIAETYDYIITIPKNGKIEIKSWAQDGSGETSAIIGSGSNLYKAPIVNPPNYLERTKMASSMNMDKTKSSSMQIEDHSSHNMMNHEMPSMENVFSYDILHSRTNTELGAERKVKEIELNLTGNMWRYVWSLNGRTLSEVDKIKINRGEVVRITLNNKTMMHHPMHLHGHFFRVLNKHGKYSPLKHTVDVEPMKSVTIEFDANEMGDWFFHCHVLYHMKGGMARVFSYGDKRDLRLQEYPLSNILNTDKHWYTWAETVGASHFGSLEITTSNTRNQVNLGAQYGWNKNLEADFSYDRYITNYFRVFTGVESENETEDDLNEIDTVATLGVKWLMPYFIDSSFRLDTDLSLQISFETEFLLLPKVLMFGYWELTSDFGLRNDLPRNSSWEKEYVWNLGFEYVIDKSLSVFMSYENRFGLGAGLSYIW